MKKFGKLIICSLLAVSFLLSPTTASAADNWPGFQDVTIGLSFGTLGKASYYTTVIPSKGSYYCKINMKLQRYYSGSWHTVTNGTYSRTGATMYGCEYYVTKGYTYRVHSVATIYKSKGGAKINTDTFNYKRKY